MRPIFYLLRIKNSSFCKYGITSDFKSRMSQYKTYCPFEIEILYKKETRLNSYLEALLNQCNYLENIKNREWIRLEKNEVNLMINFICEIVNKYKNYSIAPLLSPEKYSSEEFKKDSKFIDNVFFESFHSEKRQERINQELVIFKEKYGNVIFSFNQEK